MLNVHLHEIFCSVFAEKYRPKNQAFKYFKFVLEFFLQLGDIFKFFIIWQSLNCHEVSFHFN
jgi:hypothetical protein